MNPPPKIVFYARYNQSVDFHSQALRLISENRYVAGERSRIKKLFPNADEHNFILNSPYFIEVENVEIALKNDLKKFIQRQNFNIKSIAVTGTCGKTSTVQLAWQLLTKLKQKPVLQMGTLGIAVGNTKIKNSHVTTPDYFTFVQALQAAQKEQADTLVMEMASQALAESRLDDYPFDICVFTNFSHDQLNFHNSMEQYLAAKTRLFTNHFKPNGSCIVSTSSEEWIHIVQNSSGKGHTLYLILHHDEDIVFEKMKPLKNGFRDIYFLKIAEQNSSFSGISGIFIFMDKNKNVIFSEFFAVPIIGQPNFENLMSVFCICVAMGYHPSEFIAHFGELKCVIGRLERAVPHSPKNTPHVFIDFTHKPGALKAVLKTLRNLLSNGNKIITVLGCGGDYECSNRPLMGQIAETFSDISIITTDNPRDEDVDSIVTQIISGMTDESRYCTEPDRKRAIQLALELANESDIVLISGKGHQTEQIIEDKKIEFSDIKVATFFLNEMHWPVASKMINDNNIHCI